MNESVRRPFPRSRSQISKEAFFESRENYSGKDHDLRSSAPSRDKSCGKGSQDCAADYCVPPPAPEMPTTICVPPSSSISCFAPSRMLEAWAILGSCCPGALFATNTPGIDVVRMAMFPVLATMVPGGGAPFAAVAAPASPPALCGALLAAPPAEPFGFGLVEGADGGLPAIAVESLADAAPW